MLPDEYSYTRFIIQVSLSTYYGTAVFLKLSF